MLTKVLKYYFIFLGIIGVVPIGIYLRHIFIVKGCLVYCNQENDLIVVTEQFWMFGDYRNFLLFLLVNLLVFGIWWHSLKQ